MEAYKEVLTVELTGKPLIIIGSAAWTAPYWQHPTNPVRIFAAINGQNS